MKQLLFLTDGITPYVTGGMQQYARVLVRLLAERGIKITLVHCGFRGESTFSENTDELFPESCRENLNIVFIPFLNKGKWPGHYLYENKIYSQMIYKRFKDEINNYDVIYAQGFTGWAFGKKNIKPKLLVNFHGFEMYQKSPSLKVSFEHLMSRPFVKLNCRNADYVYSFGGKITDIIKNLGIDEARILYQSNGIEKKWVSQASVTNKPLKFIFIGRNERRKGIEELTEALIDLSRDNELDFEFTFIGPINPEPALVKHNTINYTGEIKDQTVIHQHLKNADILVCPSYAEGMPTVILEAMANGLAILTSNVGASSKMINGNGKLLESVSLDTIKKAISQFNNTSTDELNLMKQASVKIVKSQFIWEKIADSIIADIMDLPG